MDTVRNARLAQCMRAAGFTPRTLGARMYVVDKTIRRWLNGECLPYLEHQDRAAALLNVDRRELWPDPAGPDGCDLVALYTGRADIPSHLWRDLAAADGDVQVLTNDLSWFTDGHPLEVGILISRAFTGDRVHLALLDPDGIDSTSTGAALEDAALSRRTLRHFDALLDVDRAVRAQIRLHHGSPLTVLRFGSDMLVQAALDGVPGALTPTWHLRRASTAGAFDRYLTHLEQVWTHASLVQKHRQDADAATGRWPIAVARDLNEDAPAGSSLARGRVSGRPANRHPQHDQAASA